MDRAHSQTHLSAQARQTACFDQHCARACTCSASMPRSQVFAPCACQLGAMECRFNTAGRSIKTGLTASVIVSQWTWAATLLQSSNVAYTVCLRLLSTHCCALAHSWRSELT